MAKATLRINAETKKAISDIKRFSAQSQASLSKVESKLDTLRLGAIAFGAQLAAGAATRAFSELAQAANVAAQDFLAFSKAVAEVNSILPSWMRSNKN